MKLTNEKAFLIAFFTDMFFLFLILIGFILIFPELPLYYYGGFILGFCFCFFIIFFSKLSPKITKKYSKKEKYYFFIFFLWLSIFCDTLFYLFQSFVVYEKLNFEHPETYPSFFGTFAHIALICIFYLVVTYRIFKIFPLIDVNKNKIETHNKRWFLMIGITAFFYLLPILIIYLIRKIFYLTTNQIIACLLPVYLSFSLVAYLQIHKYQKKLKNNSTNN
jgi:hypothetical protein